MSRSAHNDSHEAADEHKELRSLRGHGHADDAIISKDEANRLASDAFIEGARSLSNAKIGDTKKFLGILTLDAGLVDMLNGVYNVGANYIANDLRPKIFDVAKKVAPRVGLGKHASSVAAAAAIGSTVAVKTAGYFSPMYEGFSSQLKEQKELARTLAPVLDDIKGSHSVAALFGVGIKDNEMIYAHRRRLSKIASANHLSNAINLGLNSGTSLAFDVKGFIGIWGDRGNLNAQSINRMMAVKPKAATLEETLDEHMADQNGKGVLKAGMLGVLPQAVERIAATKQHNLMKELQPYSALQMVLELKEQISGNPTARAFAAPASFQNPHRHRKEFSLEEYLMRICIQHQKDMADINPQHTEIREALRDDLAAAVQPIARAIRKGDMSVLSLVRLVGEGRIIKKHGRTIASPDEVVALVAKEAPKHAAYVQVDPAEYYKDAAFSREQMKAALKSLDNEEKLTFASMFPDSILAEAGMSKKEIKHMREATLKSYDKMLGEALLGLNAKSDEQLESKGLAKNEIREVREAAERIAQEGFDAVRDLKASPVHEHGVEHLLSNVVVHQPQYLGTLLSDGRTAIAGMENADEMRATEMAEAAVARAQRGSRGSRGRRSGHSERESQRRLAERGTHAELG